MTSTTQGIGRTATRGLLVPFGSGVPVVRPMQT